MKGENMSKNASATWLKILFIVFVLFVILGIYVFANAKGFSYLSSNSAACNNCHVMNEVYKDWQRDAHGKMKLEAGVKKPNAGCVQCHLPQGGGLDYWVEKAKAGVHHAYAFTFVYPNLPTHLSASENTKKIVQKNCITCHANYASHAINATTNPALGDGKDALNCVSCHRNAGHVRSF